jgi:tetratricopeptide (TPR) repeat protein
MWVLILLLAGGGALLGLKHFLSSTERVPVVEEPTPTPEPIPTPTPDPALRARAKTALQAVVERMRPLRQAEPEWWAGEAWDRLQADIETADQHMADAEYVRAAEAYENLVPDLDALIAELPGLPGRLLPRAKEAYAKGERDRAVGLLQAILSVESGHEQARALLPRAQVADQSFERLQQALAYAGKSEWDLAWAELKRLEKLDDAFPGASDLQEQVSREIGRMEFQDWISKAFAALERLELEEAEQFLRRAAAFDPDHSAVKDLEAQLRDLRVQRQVMELRDQAESLEHKEEWKEAYEHWLQISSLDPNTPWVKEGLARALKWKVVEEKLERGKQNPGSAQTAQWVEEFRERSGWPAGLEKKARELVADWDLRQQPVEVVLRSDFETEVSIVRVLNWNLFIEKELELKPGSYVARGRRMGYRDVRVPFEVKPGGETLEVTVICTEGI